MYYKWDVIGHEKELAFLEEDLRSGNLHHAYLFVGPEKIGKFRIAKAMAGILQCPNNFCHTCPSCIQVEKKSHPDVMEIDDDGESVKIATLRDVIARLNMTGQSNYKILLIEEIGRITEASTLLKTIEEPPERTIFIFTAAHMRDVLPTVASRMRVIHFKKLPDDVLTTALKERFSNIDEDMIRQTVMLSLGRSGHAIQLLHDPQSFEQLRDQYRDIQLLLDKSGMAGRFMAVSAASQDPKTLHSFLSLLTHTLRQRLLDPESPHDVREKMLGSLALLHRSIKLMERNVNARLLLENIMLNV